MGGEGEGPAHPVVDGRAGQPHPQEVAGDAAVQGPRVAQVDLARVVDGDAGVQVAHAGILLLHAPTTPPHPEPFLVPLPPLQGGRSSEAVG